MLSLQIKLFPYLFVFLSEKNKDETYYGASDLDFILYQLPAYNAHPYEYL